MKKLSFICFEDEKTYNQSEVDTLLDKSKEGLFDQDAVNTFLAKEKRKTQDSQKELATQLANYKKTAELSTEEKTELTKRIEELEKQYLTVEERNRQIAEKATKKHGKELEDLTAERDSWQKRFTTSTIEAAMVQAAATNKAISPEQVSAMLRPATKLVEKLDEAGKPTGVYGPRVDFQDLDKDEKPITLDLTVGEAVKRMTELERYGNLFEGGKTGGLGASGGAGKIGNVDLVKIARDDPAQYRKLRKEKPELFADL